MEKKEGQKSRGTIPLNKNILEVHIQNNIWL
jgi:hypothetical protein